MDGWIGNLRVVVGIEDLTDIGDAGSTADFRMLWSAIVCLGLLLSALDLVCYSLAWSAIVCLGCKPLDFVLRALRALRPVRQPWTWSAIVCLGLL